MKFQRLLAAALTALLLCQTGPAVLAAPTFDHAPEVLPAPVEKMPVHITVHDTTIQEGQSIPREMATVEEGLDAKLCFQSREDGTVYMDLTSGIPVNTVGEFLELPWRFSFWSLLQELLGALDPQTPMCLTKPTEPGTYTVTAFANPHGEQLELYKPTSATGTLTILPEPKLPESKLVCRAPAEDDTYHLTYNPDREQFMADLREVVVDREASVVPEGWSIQLQTSDNLNADLAYFYVQLRDSTGCIVREIGVSVTIDPITAKLTYPDATILLGQPLPAPQLDRDVPYCIVYTRHAQNQRITDVFLEKLNDGAQDTTVGRYREVLEQGLVPGQPEGTVTQGLNAQLLGWLTPLDPATPIHFGSPAHVPGHYTAAVLELDFRNYQIVDPTEKYTKLVILMNDSRGLKLNWNQQLPGYKIGSPEDFDFGATLTMDGDVNISQENVHVLYSGFTRRWKLYSSTTTPPTQPGRYVMTVVTLGGQVTAPLTRSFQIVNS